MKLSHCSITRLERSDRIGRHAWAIDQQEKTGLPRLYVGMVVCTLPWQRKPPPQFSQNGQTPNDSLLRAAKELAVEK